MSVIAQGEEVQLLYRVTFSFFQPPRPFGSCGKPAKNRAAAIKAVFASQQPTLHDGRLTLRGFSSSNTV